MRLGLPHPGPPAKGLRPTVTKRQEKIRVYKKIKQVRKLIDLSGKEIRLEVDGGITVDNIAKVARAGADTFVAGSSIFKSNNYEKTINLMRDELAKIEK